LPRAARCGVFDAVIHRVLEYVKERLEQHLDDRLVRLRISTLDEELGRLAARGSHFAHQSRENAGTHAAAAERACRGRIAAAR
jgi:hypothetical protein